MRAAHDYAPFYCEENVLRLCPSLGGEAFAVLVTNASRRIEMLRQRAGGPGTGGVLWDYHAFALSRAAEWLVWDFDTTLGFPVPAPEYLQRSFDPHAVEPPLFRVVPAPDYARLFRSDRSHMRRPDGTWAATPPPWPPADGSGGVPLADLLDPASRRLGEVITLDAMRARWSGAAG
jgi:protein N-terminal glutamine amidohydrolase